MMLKLNTLTFYCAPVVQALDIRGAPPVCAGVAARLLGAEEAAEALPGLQQRGLPALLLTGGAVVDPRGYLRCSQQLLVAR